MEKVTFKRVPWYIIVKAVLTDEGRVLADAGRRKKDSSWKYDGFVEVHYNKNSIKQN